MAHYYPTEAALCEELRAYCEAQRLPHLSANELIHEELTSAQRAWVSDYICRWEAFEDREREEEEAYAAAEREEWLDDYNYVGSRHHY